MTKKDLRKNTRELDMTKLKRTIDKSFEKRITIIENLLKEHNTQIIGSNTLLGQHIISFNKIVEELRNHELQTKKEIQLMHNKLNEVLTIKVNGATGLENILKIIYQATKKERVTQNLFNSIKEWLDIHATIKAILKSRPITVALTILLTMGGLKLFRIDITHLNIVDFIKSIF